MCPNCSWYPMRKDAIIAVKAVKITHGTIKRCCFRAIVYTPKIIKAPSKEKRESNKWLIGSPWHVVQVDSVNNHLSANKKIEKKVLSTIIKYVAFFMITPPFFMILTQAIEILSILLLLPL